MKKSLVLSLVLALVAVLALTGCSASTDIKSGATKMKSVLADVQKAVDAGDAEKAKKEADELDEAWEKFEDGVKEKDKALYGNIEDHLSAIKAGAKKSPLDKNLLATEIKALDGLLVGLTK